MKSCLPRDSVLIHSYEKWSRISACSCTSGHDKASEAQALKLRRILGFSLCVSSLVGFRQRADGGGMEILRERVKKVKAIQKSEYLETKKKTHARRY